MDNNSKLVASRVGGKKGKSSANFPPVTVKYKNVTEDKIPEGVQKLIDNFLNSTSTESQLTITKSILDSVVRLKDVSQEYIIKFLVLVLVESELKHPVKCLLIRQVDQLDSIHDVFMKHLSQILQSYAGFTNDNDYTKCVKFILGLSSCFENFPLGVKTVENIALKVLERLFSCIMCCIHKLKYNFPVDKLEISKLIHQTLHLYLNVCHKATLEDIQVYNKHRTNMVNITEALVFRDDISMDSKALLAVIQVTMEKNHHMASDPWVHGEPMASLHPWLKYGEREESVLLCYYYALVTSAPGDVAFRLDFASSPQVTRHILTLIKNVVHITDRLSGSVSVSLCGARALAAASDWLNNAGPIKNKSNAYDPNKEQSDSDNNESDLDNIEFDLNQGESESDTNKSYSTQFKYDSTPYSWICPRSKREHESEVYMGRTLELARVLVKFAERRLQHHVPALRHLAEQIQANVLLYCLRYHPEEVSGWLNIEGGLVRDKMALLRRAGAAAGGGALLRAVLAPRALLPLLHNEHKQPHVSALLDTYIERECTDLDSAAVFARWFPPALEAARGALAAVVLDVLVQLLAKAIDIQSQLLTFVSPLIENPDATTSANLKCTLFLMNVISKSKASKKYQDTDDKWNGLVSYDVLEAAILDDDDQVVRLCMRAAWGRAGHGSARLVLAFLRDAAHRPRALHADTLRALTQFLKSIEKEYRSCNENEKYVEILVQVRSRCISSLVRGANHHRRGLALLALHAVSGLHLEGYRCEWSLEEVETVMRHLDDNYERNKQMALDILKTCPRTLLRKAVLSNNMASMESLLEGVSCRARDAEGAAYKLELLVTTLPDIVLADPEIGPRAEIECVRHATCAGAARRSGRMQRAAPYRAAALTLLRTQLERVPLTWQDEGGKTRLLSEVSREWCQLAERAFECALTMLEWAAPLVEAASPEGHVPPTFFGKLVEPHPYEPHLYMVGEETMTSQTMLLHAWTCAKEAWLILARGSQLLPWSYVSPWWEPLAERLARARHRAVHDHATKAYVTILRKKPEMSEAPRLGQVGELAVEWVGGADGTRRAAGLAGLVLAVAVAHPDLRYIDLRRLTTIHQPGAHHAAMAVLRARETARAAHAVLPALLRHALHDAASADATLQWACVGVVGAGVRRMAGAHAPGAGADGGTHAPGERGRLRTSVFISRYPGLYEYILECVDRASVREKSMCASVACSLVLLSRLLPDAGTGTGTLLGGVQAACGSPSYHTRRLAAAAAAANLPPTMYTEHATFVLKTLSNRDIAKNLCHGLILRLLAMIDEAPELPWAPTFAQGLPPTLWIIDSPCFPLVHEYLYLITVLVNRYPSSLEAGYRSALGAGCGRAALGRVLPGAQLCVARALGVAAALSAPPQAAELISKGLNSRVHEVCLASLECLVSALGEPGVGSLPVAPAVWTALGESEGKPALLDRVARIMQTHIHLECRRMGLHVLVLEGAHAHFFGEKYESREGSLDTWIVTKLTWYMGQCGAPGLQCGRGAPSCPRGETLYARALDTHLHTMRAAAAHEPDGGRARCSQWCIQQLSECMWRWAAAREPRGVRDAVRGWLRAHGGYLATHDDDSLHISIYLCAASARLSEGGCPGPGHVTPPAQGEPALLLALALLYFDLDEQADDDQYQSFDNETDSELYEEGIWTDRCTDMLIENYARTNPGQTITAYILSLIKQYETLEAVCGIHLKNLQKLLNGESEISNLHCKVELFVSKVKAFDASCYDVI